MPADNPVSWFLLMLLGLYGIYKFLRKVYEESERLKAEREQAVQEIFLESPIDKRNAVWYNKYINEKGNHYYEHYDD